MSGADRDTGDGEDEGTVAERSDDDRLATGLFDVLELIAPGAQVTAWTRLPGASASLVDRVEVRMPSGAATAFVVRRFAEEHPGSDVLREAETLEALRATHVPAPELLWLDADGAVFGRPALAVTLVPGRPSVSPGDAERWTAGFAEAVAAIHLVTPGAVAHLPVVDDLEALVARTLSAAGAFVPSGDLAPIASTLRAGVAAAEGGDVRLVHGDVHVANLLREGDDRISGVVDWQHAHVGDPLRDVGYAHHDLWVTVGPDAAEGFVERYATYCGRAVDAVWWWALLAAVEHAPDVAYTKRAYRDLGWEVGDDLARQRAADHVAVLLERAG